MKEYFLYIKLSMTQGNKEHSHEKCFCHFNEVIEKFKTSDEAIKYFRSLKKNEPWADSFVQHAYIEEVNSKKLEEYSF
jgi:hypothetical protein